MIFRLYSIGIHMTAYIFHSDKLSLFIYLLKLLVAITTSDNGMKKIREEEGLERILLSQSPFLEKKIITIPRITRPPTTDKIRTESVPTSISDMMSFCVF